MKTWSTYEAFQVPMDPKDESLLLAALEKEPEGPWAAYISMKFAQTKFEARSLDTAGRTALYDASLRYLIPARDTLARAAEAKPHDKELRHNLNKIKKHVSLASMEADLDLAEVKSDAEAALAANTDTQSWNYGNTIYSQHTLLGRVALREGKLDEAKKQLLAAGHTPGSPQLNSYGPDFTLARELAEKGEYDTVLVFLDLVAHFWANPDARTGANSKRVASDHLKLLESWKKELQAGKVPNHRKWKLNKAALDARLDTFEQQTASPVPSVMVLVPAGDFVMGDTFGEGVNDELPLHTNTVSAFYMDTTETTKAKWDEVYTWATANGYTFNNTGLGKATDHPVHTINWYDCVKWANARSEMEGQIPCYTLNGEVYRTGNSAVPACDWQANGYRLPTEAEWEKAARGGSANRRFPWSDTNRISHSRANYYAKGGDPYDDSDGADFHPGYNSGRMPYTSPAGSFAPNGYGLYDMAGNLHEWCWDRYGHTYYASSPSVDPRGSGSGGWRVARDGYWYRGAKTCRVARRFSSLPGKGYCDLGFRLVRAAQ